MVAAGLVCCRGGFGALMAGLAVRCSEMNHVLMVILTSLMSMRPHGKICGAARFWCYELALGIYCVGGWFCFG